MSDMFGVLSPILLWGMILGLVEFSKKFGVSGNWLVVEAALLGLLFGTIYQLGLGMPTRWIEWFSIIVYSILFGLSVSGFYDLGKRAGQALLEKNG